MSAVAPAPMLISVADWYTKLADWILANPSGKLHEASRALNASPSWLGMVVRSDSFRSYLKRRVNAQELLPNAASRTTSQRVAALADIALDAITERIERTGAAMPIATLQESAALALKHLAAIEGGGDRRAPSGAPVQVNIVVGNDVLERARAIADDSAAAMRSVADDSASIAALPDAALPVVHRHVNPVDIVRDALIDVGT